MKYIIHIVLVFLLLNVSVQALSLKEAVNDSLSNNLSLKIEVINVDMAEEDYLQSTTDYFPTITLSGSMSENDYSDIKSQSGSATNGYELSPSSKSIVLSQNVFSGFSRFYSSLSTKEQLHIQNLTQSKVTQDIILETIDAYYNVLLAQKIVQSNKDNFNSVSERFNATSKEFEVGLASKTDVAQSDAFLILDKDFPDLKIGHVTVACNSSFVSSSIVVEYSSSSVFEAVRLICGYKADLAIPIFAL